jgi:hypothetical protein
MHGVDGDDVLVSDGGGGGGARLSSGTCPGPPISAIHGSSAIRKNSGNPRASGLSAAEDSDTAGVLRQSGALHRIVPPLQTDRIRQAVKELAVCVQKQEGTQPAGRRIGTFTRAAVAALLADYLDRMTGAARYPEKAEIAWPAATRQTESIPTASG